MPIAKVSRALVNDPPIVLADEPTGALDRRTGEEVLELLGALVVERNATLVMATHSEDAKRAAGRIVAVEDGKITGETRNGMEILRIPKDGESSSK